MKKKSQSILLLVICILSVMLITVGITFAVFTYTKMGSTENTISTGTIEFLYTENSGVGAGINITNALPVSNDVGKAYSTENYVFDFKIEGKNTGPASIPYEITLREISDGSLAPVMNIYLTDMNDNKDLEILPVTKFSFLTDTTVDSHQYTEKTIYNGKVPANNNNYIQNFRLRIWMDEHTDFTPVENIEGNLVYPYNGKDFKAIVNVYADSAKVISSNN